MENRTTFIKKVSTFVSHAKRLSECDNYMRNVEFQLALQRCAWVLKQLQKNDFSLAYLKAEVKSNEKYFTKILPHPGNKSYESSLEKLKELMAKPNATIIQTHYPISGQTHNQAAL